MSAFACYSLDALSKVIGDMREAFRVSGFVGGKWSGEKPRSINQNDIGHAWYAQVAQELREDTELGVKCYCKLHHGIPILRAADEEFRATYDKVVRPLTYEQKLEVMKILPVTSLMNKAQKSAYLEAVQADFQSPERRSAGRAVILEFPLERAA